MLLSGQCMLFSASILVYYYYLQKIAIDVDYIEARKIIAYLMNVRLILSYTTFISNMTIGNVNGT